MRIEEFFKLHKNVAVAFSGGVDSAVLLFLAKQYADRVEAYFVKSDFQPQFEYDNALNISDMLGVKTNIITVDILADTKVVVNPEDRCYYCKKRIFESIISSANKDGFESVIDGTNASDDVSDRPGYKALGEMGVISPLRQCGLTKKNIRKIAEDYNFPVAHKPSYACLATRIPAGTLITKELLEKTEKAEESLLELGFKNFRVRYNENNAKIELGSEEFELMIKNRDKVTALLSPYYNNIYLDLKERTDE